jgi:PBSX family phage portal protein
MARAAEQTDAAMADAKMRGMAVPISDQALPDAKPEPRKGKAYTFVKTDRGLFPIDALHRSAIQKAADRVTRAQSKQLKSDAQYMTEYNLVPLPFEVAGLLTIMENCAFFDKAVRQIARDVVGQGFDLDLKDEADKTEEEPAAPPELGPDGQPVAATPPPAPVEDPERKRILEFLEDPNEEDETLEEIFEAAIIDYNTIGWLTLEVGRDPEGKINMVSHIPAHTIRVHREGQRYCQIRGVDRIWFKKFGVEEDIDARTGQPLKKGDVDNKANEMIFKRLYYPRSSWYGAPPILSAVGAVKALIGIRDYNLAFFENYGIPAALITITGEWDDDSVTAISNFIDAEIKGSNNAHKTVVLNPPEGGEVSWDPLVVEIKEGHFKLYTKNLRDEILVCYCMPPYRIGIAEQGSLGGSTASESTRIYIDSTVNPIKLLTARIITKKIIQAGLENDTYEFWWGEVDTRDMTAIVARCVQLFGIGSMSRNEIRVEIGLEKLPLEEEGDKYYISSTYVPIADAGANAAAMGKETRIDELAARVDGILAGEKSIIGGQSAHLDLHTAAAADAGD